jgi:hypothetical protein
MGEGPRPVVEPVSILVQHLDGGNVVPLSVGFAPHAMARSMPYRSCLGAGVLQPGDPDSQSKTDANFHC